MKDIPNFNGYRIDEYGNVYSAWKIVRDKKGRLDSVLSERWNLLKKHIAKNGYFIVALRVRKGKTSGFYIHHLMVDTFLGGKKKGMYVCHNDSNKLNNHVSNLRIDTPTGNMRDAINNGTTMRGERSPLSKLNKEKIAMSRIFYYYFKWSQSAIGRLFNVDQSTISYAINGKTYKQGLEDGLLGAKLIPVKK